MTAPVALHQPAARVVASPQQAEFDPAAWLASLTEIGGRYALVADRRLWIGVDDWEGEDLAPVMADLIGRPDRQEAVKRVIEQRQNGEAH